MDFPQIGFRIISLGRFWIETVNIVFVALLLHIGVCLFPSFSAKESSADSFSGRVENVCASKLGLLTFSVSFSSPSVPALITLKRNLIFEIKAALATSLWLSMSKSMFVKFFVPSQLLMSYYSM